MSTFNQEHLARVKAFWPLRNRLRSDHGPAHWCRVWTNAGTLAHQIGGITPYQHEALELASLFHDSQRLSEHDDPGHGGRGAALLASMVASGHISVAHASAVPLAIACCAYHTDLVPDNDPDDAQPIEFLDGRDRRIVRLFCDADRLDLSRLGYIIDTEMLFFRQSMAIAVAKNRQQLETR